MPAPKNQWQEFSDLMNQAYAAQRNFRDRYPVADAALGFVPGIGQATAIDDMVRDVRQGQYGNALWDSVGLLPFGKSVAVAAKGARELETAARMAALASGQPHLVHVAGDAVRGGVWGLAGMGAGTYAADVAQRQIDANNKEGKP